MWFERLPSAALDQQRLEHVLDPLRRAEDPLHPSPSTPARHHGEIARPRVARALAIHHDGNAGREVGLADEELAAPGQLDDGAVYT